MHWHFPDESSLLGYLVMWMAAMETAVRACMLLPPLVVYDLDQEYNKKGITS